MSWVVNMHTVRHNVLQLLLVSGCCTVGHLLGKDSGMLSPRNCIGIETKNYGLGLGLVLVASALNLGLGLVDAVASASTVWPRGLIVL